MNEQITYIVTRQMEICEKDAIPVCIYVFFARFDITCGHTTQRSLLSEVSPPTNGYIKVLYDIILGIFISRIDEACLYFYFISIFRDVACNRVIVM